MQLGKKIRDLRLRRGLTVQQLAAATGLSKGFVSQVENQRTSPSLATLRDLARALETSAAYLVGEQEDQAPCIVRASERSHASVGGNRSQVEVLSARANRNLELLMVELPAGQDAGEKQHHHHGEECLLCMEGRIRLTCGERIIELSAGDSCHFDGRVPHAIGNCGPTTARVLIASAPAAHELLLRAGGDRSRPADEAPHLVDALR
jgi:transcriptional regulator with XRE-family HTH domain